MGRGDAARRRRRAVGVALVSALTALWTVVVPGSAHAQVNPFAPLTEVGDNGPAETSRLFFPNGIAVLPDGGFLIGDSINHRIRKVSKDGIITTVAGTGVGGFSGDGGPATSAQLFAPQAVNVTRDGGFLIGDSINGRVRKVSKDGIITTVAGNGTTGYSGDGGPATSAAFTGPEAAAPTRDGGFLVADSFNHCIRKVSKKGIITTVAGTCTSDIRNCPGFGGDGGPATDATLCKPEEVSETADGGFLIADGGNGRIRKVSTKGIITTVAGNGTAGTGGDGGPATEANLDTPWGVEATNDGGFLITDFGAQTVRKVSRKGIITTVAGNGSAGYSGDGGPATKAQICGAEGAAETPDGGYIMSDSANNVVRKVSPKGIITTVAGKGTSATNGRTPPILCRPTARDPAMSAAVDAAINAAIAAAEARSSAPTGQTPSP